MLTRRIGPFEVSAVGLGCMNLSHAYGTPPAPEAAGALLLHALERGITHFDTAALYGFGANEALLGRVLRYQKLFGAMHWQPARLLVELVGKGQSLADWQRTRKQG